jgi:HAD superfamily hydrolase (TIGR01549 family)
MPWNLARDRLCRASKGPALELAGSVASARALDEGAVDWEVAEASNQRAFAATNSKGHDHGRAPSATRLHRSGRGIKHSAYDDSSYRLTVTVTRSALILDIDGTLVDSTYHHALAWHRAFSRYDVLVPLWRLHRAVGMGGDRLVSAVAGEQVEAELGDDLRSVRAEEWDQIKVEVSAFADVRATVEQLRERGWRMAVASSSPAKNAAELLELAEVTDLVVTADDVSSSKPDPEVLLTALSAAGCDYGLCIGDATHDVNAATNAGMRCIGLRSGGYGAAELMEAGSPLVLDVFADLRLHLSDPILRPEE